MDKAPEAFRTISEVADWLGVQPHVLRFWESKFPQIKPVKRAGGRRYYRPSDMLLLGGLRKLLHEDGLTIKGAQKVLREQGVRAVQAMSAPLDEEVSVGLDTAGMSPDGDAADFAGTAGPDVTTESPLGTPDAAPSGNPVANGTTGADAGATAPPAAAAQPLPEIRKRPRPRDLPDLADTPPPRAAAPRAAQIDTAAPTLFDHAARSAQGDTPLPDPQPDARAVADNTGTGAPSPAEQASTGPGTPPDIAPATSPGARADSTAPATGEAERQFTGGTPAGDTRETSNRAAPAFRSRLGGMIAGESAAPDAAPPPPATEVEVEVEAPADPTAPQAVSEVPLPSSDLPLDTALSMLTPGQVPAIRLRPIYEQMVALRARMDAAR